MVLHNNNYYLLLYRVAQKSGTYVLYVDIYTILALSL